MVDEVQLIQPVKLHFLQIIELFKYSSELQLKIHDLLS